MTETTKYDVIETKGVLEVRLYPQLLLATVRTDDENAAFMKLFRYISGDNEKGRKMAMTAPVLKDTGAGSTKIAMTTPVIETSGSLSFVMPADIDIDSLPSPKDDDVFIEQRPSRKVAVIRFKGGAREGQVEKMRQTLMETVGKEGFHAKGEPFEMYYNGPFVPGFLRRNEVAVEVE